MEKVILRNELGRMEKMLSSQKSQQSKMAENYHNLLEILLQFQKPNSNQNGMSKSKLPAILATNVKQLLLLL